MRWALDVTLSPGWFDPAAVTGVWLDVVIDNSLGVVLDALPLLTAQDIEARLPSVRCERYAVFKVGEDAESPHKNQVGLAHIALVADSFDTVKAMYQRLKAHDVPIVRTVDHGITKSVYFKDPEGNELEIYCEAPGVDWREVETIIVADPIDLEAVSTD